MTTPVAPDDAGSLPGGRARQRAACTDTSLGRAPNVPASAHTERTGALTPQPGLTISGGRGQQPRASAVRFATDGTSAQDILNADFSSLNSTVTAALQEYRER